MPVLTFNLNLFAVGIAIAAIGILGVVIFLRDAKNSTGRAFLFLAIATTLYSIVNYLNAYFTSPVVVLWLLRLTLFFSVIHAFSLFWLAYVFPAERTKALGKWVIGVTFVVVAVAVLTLTPLVFVRVDQIAPLGQVTNPVRGMGILFFGITVVFLVGAGIVLLIKKFIAAAGIEKRQFGFILVGAAITFLSLIFFNYVAPVYFNQLNLIPLAPIYFFPFIALTAYAIVRHHLMNIKVVSTEIFAFVLTVVTFSEVIFSQSLAETLLRSGEFTLILIFGIFLIKSVLREVEQREELQRLNEKIEADNKQLAELGRFKSQLLSLASHQIRSPLAAMKGFITLIQGGAYGEVNDKVKDTLKKVQNSADDLIGLINTLLDVRKVEEGKMEYTFAKEDLVPLVKGIVEGIQPLALAKNLTLSAELPSAPVMVSIDHEKFKQVIQNLVDNAIKYTPSGFVKVNLAVSAGKANIAVSDSGLGVPADLIPFLFEEFIRDERVKKEIRGTGLGLYIARKIAESHGGTMYAESPGEGKGSTFHVAIPVAQ